MPNDIDRIRNIIALTRDDPAAFAELVLGVTFWSRQVEMSSLVVKYKNTVVVSGNQIGKTTWLACIILWWLYTRPESIVITTSSTHNQLVNGLWRAIKDIHANAPIPLGGRISQGEHASPQMLVLGNNHKAIGLSTTKKEKIAGLRSKTGNTLLCADEASGVLEAVYEGLDSIGAAKLVYIGNPTRSSGRFYDLYHKAQHEPTADIGAMRVPATDSPDIDLDVSPRGMACQGWLRDIETKYGRSSLFWRCAVLAEWADSSEDHLIPREWLDRISAASPVPGGPIRIAVDLGLGTGGDSNYICVRDDHRILELVGSNTWSFEVTSNRVRHYADKYGVKPSYIYFDAGGLGADFANRLAGVGLAGCRGYMGGSGGGKRFSNLRTHAAWLLRRRLDPDRLALLPNDPEFSVPQRQFWMSPEHLSMLRRDMQELRYSLSASGKTVLEAKAEMKKRTGHSPDALDAVIISFAFTN